MEALDDNETMMDHVALECMHAIEAKDKATFLECFHVLLSDILDKLRADLETKEE